MTKYLFPAVGITDGSHAAALNRCAVCGARGIAVCGSMTPPELVTFGQEMQQINLDAGQPLIDEGESDDYIFSVVSGCLKSYKTMPDGRRQVTGFMFAGDFLGLTKSDHYPSSVEAVSPAVLCRMERRKLDHFTECIDNLEHRLHDLTGEALADSQGQMLLLGRKTAAERLATFLLKLAARAKMRGRPDNPVAVPMSREDIADFLGLTTETVSRTFTKLRKAGLIGADQNHQIEVLDRAELERMAEGL